MEYMRRHLVWIQQDIIVRSPPREYSVCKEIMRFKAFVLLKPKVFHRKICPGALRIIHIQIYDHYQNIGLYLLAVAEKFFVVDKMEA